MHPRQLVSKAGENLPFPEARDFLQHCRRINLYAQDVAVEAADPRVLRDLLAHDAAPGSEETPHSHLVAQSRGTKKFGDNLPYRSGGAFLSRGQTSSRVMGITR